MHSPSFALFGVKTKLILSDEGQKEKDKREWEGWFL
jgi:hypothetical protein